VCGRYVSVSSPALLAERFHVTEVRLPETALEPNYNVAPRAEVPVIAERRVTGAGEGEHEHVRVLDLVRWGLVPFWAKDVKVGDRMINARADHLASSNAFKRPFERRRCIVRRAVAIRMSISRLCSPLSLRFFFARIGIRALARQFAGSPAAWLVRWSPN